MAHLGDHKGQELGGQIDWLLKRAPPQREREAVRRYARSVSLGARLARIGAVEAMTGLFLVLILTATFSNRFRNK
jgi:hypothetical protein